jgi:predicted P-loop ATPase
VYGTKKAVGEEWQTRRITADLVPQYFNTERLNVSVLVGDDHNHVDADLDCQEARVGAQVFLPETRCVFGRESAPASHFFYTASRPLISRRFNDPIRVIGPDGKRKQATILELRARKKDGTIGLQTIVPTSMHPSGEIVRFEPGLDGEPTAVDADMLERAVSVLAAAALLAKYFPGDGVRHEAFLALAGTLVRGGLSYDDILRIHRVVYLATWPSQAAEDWSALESEVRTTVDRFTAGGPTTGFPRLVEFMDEKAVCRALEWLGAPGQQSKKGQHGDWRDLLLRNEDGKLLRTHHNVVLHLKNELVWKGVAGYNEFTGTPIVLATPPQPITTPIGAELDDHFDIGAVIWFERVGLAVAPAIVRSAMDFHARERAFHPVRDYLDSLVWDGVPRLDTWLIVYLNATAQDLTRDPTRNPVYHSAYLAAVGRMFLISAVARIYRPGCQVDHTMVLEGLQGGGRTSTVRTLAVNDAWTTDQVHEFGSKDTAQLLRGIWIVELAELTGMVSTRAETEKVKAFLTQRDDRFRLPYGHRPMKFPRSCVFIGTTNADEYLRDETGNRRFWPVSCGSINLEGLRGVVGQLHAEARVRFEQGDPWWITDPKILEAAKDEQRSRELRDAWHERVMELARLDLDAHGSTSTRAILAALGVPLERQDQTHKNRVARIFALEGWKRFHTGSRTAREYRYKPGEQVDKP